VIDNDWPLDPEVDMPPAKLYTRTLFALFLVLLPPSGAAAGGNDGLDPWARAELIGAGVNKYLGQYTPVSSREVGDGWVKHEFDPAGGEGPICIDGSTFSVFTRKGRDLKKLLIMLQGGGACWQDLYRCSQSTAGQEPPGPSQGIWDFERKDNPFARYSIVYMPYCDGSVFSGDNLVTDPKFVPDDNEQVAGVRHHRGLRNLSAGMDVAKATFKKVKMVTVAGSSAGGVGATGFAPFLVRFLYGNKLKKFTVFNDAGPLAISLDSQDAVAARDALAVEKRSENSRGLLRNRWRCHQYRFCQCQPARFLRSPAADYPVSHRPLTEHVPRPGSR
jgi:hypothetical protein